MCTCGSFICIFFYFGGLVTKSCLILVTPMDCSPPGFSVHGIFQARILEWVAILFSRHLPDPGMEPTSPAWQAESLLLRHQGNSFYFGSKGIYAALTQ